MFTYLVVIVHDKMQSIKGFDLCTETCTSTYDIYNIVNICVCCAFVGLNNKPCKMHGTYIKI
jgi:hypothetical protein